MPQTDHLINGIFVHLESFKEWTHFKATPLNFSDELPTLSPPFTPMLGCSLADKMTSTIPTMNHSFRILATRPMFQLAGDPPALLACPPRSQQPGQKFPHSGASSTKLLSSQNTGRGSRGCFRTHGPKLAVKTRLQTHRLTHYRNTTKSSTTCV